jgi:polar amino acid transport system ATP-binding protein
MNSEIVLEASDLHKDLGGRSVLRGVSFKVAEGSACTIIGPSGEGKTTLLKCLNLLVAIDRGSIRFRDKLIVECANRGDLRMPGEPAAFRRRVGMVFQEWNLWPNMRVRDNIALAPKLVLGLNKSDATKIAEEMARRVRLTESLDAYPYSLSGGQKQRAAIARALAMKPEILMLDEITSALDPVLAAEVLDVILQLKAEGRTLLIVTHHIEFARAVSDQIIFLHGGRVHEFGTPSILDEPKTPELQRFLQKVRRTH